MRTIVKCQTFHFRLGKVPNWLLITAASNLIATLEVAMEAI